ncbi:MAG: lamin tail domain-containing protein, partial [Candidatus Krumholzibacteriia bacterium]
MTPRKLALLALLFALRPLQTHAGMVINEALPNPSGSDTDNERVEIYNTGPDPVDTSGWAIEDAATIDNSSIRRRIPEDFEAAHGTDPVIQPGEFRVVLGTGGSGAAYLNNTGDTIYLVSDRTGNLSSVVHSVSYSSAPAGQCWANIPDGSDPANFDWRGCTFGVSNCASDAIPPDPVTDLAAAPGAWEGEVDLTWTAVGNDGQTGLALLHVVKYNTVPITSGNFDASFDAFNEPLPGSPGTPHSMTVFGLTPGQTHWFAIKTLDCQNTSGLSTSVPSTLPGVTPLPFVDRTIDLQHWYGTLHSHSTYSDGADTPTAAWNFARNLAPTPLDFLAVTDHNHSGAGPMTPALYQLGLAEAAATTVDGSFVAIYGQEWGLAVNGHVNVFESPVLFGWQAGNFDVFVAQDDYTGLYTAVRNNPSSWGALAELCHPGSGDFESYAVTVDGASVLRGIALINGPAFSQATDESDVGNTNFDSQFHTALNNGLFVSPYGDQDNHNPTWGASSESRAVILATTLSKDSLMAGIAARRTFASQDHNVQVNMKADGWPMGARFTAKVGAGVNFDVSVSDSDGDNVAQFELLRGTPGSATPAIVATAENVDRFVYRDEEVPAPLDGAKRVYYLRITQDDNHRIWTGPVEVTFSTAVAVAENPPGARLAA